jgi:hypothetical protein
VLTTIADALGKLQQTNLSTDDEQTEIGFGRHRHSSNRDNRRAWRTREALLLSAHGAALGLGSAACRSIEWRVAEQGL